MDNNQAIKGMESKIQVLNEKIKSNEEIANKRIATLKQEKDAIWIAYNEYNDLKNSLQIERDKLKAKLQETEINLKNEKFERTNLNVFYKNSLNTGQEKSDQIKKLDIRLSQLN